MSYIIRNPFREYVDQLGKVVLTRHATDCGRGDRLRFEALPFGVRLPCGTTFSQSVFDRESALVKVCNYLWAQPRPRTKREICMDIFGFKSIGKKTYREQENGTLVPVNLDGWRSPWFKGMVDAKFLFAWGRPRQYQLAPLGYYLVEFHSSEGSI